MIADVTLAVSDDAGDRSTGREVKHRDARPLGQVPGGAVSRACSRTRWRRPV